MNGVHNSEIVVPPPLPNVDSTHQLRKKSADPPKEMLIVIRNFKTNTYSKSTG